MLEEEEEEDGCGGGGSCCGAGCDETAHKWWLHTQNTNQKLVINDEPLDSGAFCCVWQAEDDLPEQIQNN